MSLLSAISSLSTLVPELKPAIYGLSAKGSHHHGLTT